RLVEEEDGTAPPSDQRWWRPIGVLLLGMVLIATVMALTFTQPGGPLPASMGGISGLLGAAGVRGAAGLLPEAARGWTILGTAIVCLVAGLALAGRVFAFDWAALLTLPGRLRGRRALPEPDGLAFEAPRDRKQQREPRPAAAAPADNPRKPPEITDPTRPAKPA